MFDVPGLDPTKLLQLLQAAGALGAAVIGIWGGLRGWWFPAWYVNELRDRLAKAEAATADAEKDRDEWKELAHSNARTASEGADLVRHVLAAVQPNPDRSRG